MSSDASEDRASGRAGLISEIKTYLTFYALIVLAVEATLGGLALKAQGTVQLLAMAGMIAVIVLLIGVVSFFAYFKPEALLRAAAPPEARAIAAFCDRIDGDWWERITPDTESAISLVEIRPDAATRTVKMTGRAYTRDGRLAASWESVASCINPSEHKIFYYWKGLYHERPGEPFEGFGEIVFSGSPERAVRGQGVFSDSNLVDMKSTTRKSAEFTRVDEADRSRIGTGDARTLAELVGRQLA